MPQKRLKYLEPFPCPGCHRPIDMAELRAGDGDATPNDWYVCVYCLFLGCWEQGQLRGLTDAERDKFFTEISPFQFAREVADVRAKLKTFNPQPSN